MKTYLVKAGHSWDTIEACYSEIVDVHKGYAIVKLHDTLGVMRMRGYDIVQELEEGDIFDFDTLKVIKAKKPEYDVAPNETEASFTKPKKPRGGGRAR